MAGYVKRLMLFFLLPLILSSCAFMPLAADDDLLTAPILSREQAEISEALQKIINLADIAYRYPQPGNYRSSFIFYDINGDGYQEAVIFYAYSASPQEARAKILTQSADGSWRVFGDISGRGDAIEFVRFTPVFTGGQDSMVIGWKNTAYQQTTLGVYTMRDVMEEDLLERCGAHAIHDFDGDGLSEIVITQRIGDRHTVKLLRTRLGRIFEADSKTLYEETSSVPQMLLGRLWDNTMGIYIDEKIDNAFYGTEVFSSDGNRLTPLSYGGDLNDAALWPVFTSTFREESVLSADLSGNGVILVPSVEPLPGVQEGAIPFETSPPPLVKYSALTGEGGFQVRFNAVVNSAAGYMVFYPQRWLGNVTLIESTETKEWSFRKYDSETEEISAELFRIRVYSTEDYMDPSLKEDIHFATRGIYRYYGYIPKNIDDPLALTQEEAQNMFALITSG